MWPAATSKRCDGRKTRLRASSFNDARVGRGSQPLRKTQLRSGGLFFPDAMGAMRGRALGIERAKRIGSRKGGVSCRVRMTFELVSDVGWWTGVRWNWDWHLAKEGLWMFVTQASTVGPLKARGTNNDWWEHSEGASQRQGREKRRKMWKRVVKKLVKKMEGREE